MMGYTAPMPQQRRIPLNAVLVEESSWDMHPYVLDVEGSPREFYTIGHLAAALERSTGTIRYWESQKLFPKPTFTVNGKDKYKKRRLYTRVQIEGALQIALDEGLLSGNRRYLTQSRFTERCFQFFATHRELPPPLFTVKETSNDDSNRTR